MASDLETRLGYTFRNSAFFVEAMTHSTYANEHRVDGVRDNQRLEFLGDTIVNAAITRKVFLAIPDGDEGRLTKIRAELVSEGSLVNVALHLNIGDALLLGKGEELDGGRVKPSIIADAFEALIGAIFLDSSFEEACAVVERLVDQVVGELARVSITDYKSALIEYCQSRFRCQPEIMVEEETGPEHEKTFVVVVKVNGEVIGRGNGRNKKLASQNACREALQSLNARHS